MRINKTTLTLPLVALLLAACSSAEQTKDSQQNADEICIKRHDLKLLFASGTGDIQAMTAAIKAGANVNIDIAEISTPIVMAGLSHNTRAVQLLLDHGANVNSADSNGYTALVNAVMRNDYATAQLLISKGADVNAPAQPIINGNKVTMSPLVIARSKGYEPMVKLLTDAGAKEVTSESPAASPR